MLEHAKSSILPNGNFWEFFSLAGGLCVFKTGIPGNPDLSRRRASTSVDRSV